jgi:hypothetical protein
VDDCPSLVVIDGIASDALPDRVLSFLNPFWQDLIVGFQYGSFIKLQPFVPVVHRIPPEAQEYQQSLDVNGSDLECKINDFSRAKWDQVLCSS